MTATHAADHASSWIFLKLYLGRTVDRMDRLLIDLARESALTQRASAWFYIRYVDEQGIHIRLRAKPRAGDEEALRRDLIDLTARKLARLHELPPGDYFPMVAMPGFEQALDQLANAHNDINVVEAPYEPEYDKFGGPQGIEIAEALFHASSVIACRVLEDDERGRYSRKDVMPALLDATFHAFLPAENEQSFWREYCYYWLNGKSPAADDWRDQFFAKSRELAQRSIRVVPEPHQLPPDATLPLRDWHAALQTAAARYAELGRHADAAPEVLGFNFAHLMSNRLGLGTLEEAYLGALLEQRAAESVDLKAA